MNIKLLRVRFDNFPRKLGCIPELFPEMVYVCVCKCKCKCESVCVFVCMCVCSRRVGKGVKVISDQNFGQRLVQEVGSQPWSCYVPALPSRPCLY